MALPGSCAFPHPAWALRSPCQTSCKFIIFKTRFIIFNIKFIICNSKFIVFNTKFIIFHWIMQSSSFLIHNSSFVNAKFISSDYLPNLKPAMIFKHLGNATCFYIQKATLSIENSSFFDRKSTFLSHLPRSHCWAGGISWCNWTVECIRSR